MLSLPPPLAVLVDYELADSHVLISIRTGLVKKATALLAWQVSTGDLDRANDSQTAVRCGWGCTLLAVSVLVSVFGVVVMGLLMLRHFWRRFHAMAWQPAPPACKSNEVHDPLFRLWSALKLVIDRWICCTAPPHVPRADDVKAMFKKYDANGEGTINTSELSLLLRDLMIHIPDDIPDAEPSRARDDAEAVSHHRLAPWSRVGRLFGRSGGSQRRARATKLLRKYDKSGDGTLNETEFVLLMRQLINEKRVLRSTDRMRGSWLKPQSETSEPERTERLLSEPFGLLRGRSADCQESMSLHLMVKTSGHLGLGLGWAWATMVVQVSCAILSGVGPYLGRGTGVALAQVVGVALVKLLWAAVLLYWAPCVCLLTNTVVAMQFLSEGSSTLLVLIASGEVVATNSSHAELLRLISFFLLLIPVFMPVFQKLYETIVVNLIVNCCRKKFNATAAAVTCLQLLLILPTFLGKVLGVGMSFNTAKLAVSASAVVNDTKRLQKTRISKACSKTVKRTVRRRKHVDEDAALMAAGVCAMGGLEVSSQRHSDRADAERGVDDGEGADDLEAAQADD